MFARISISVSPAFRRMVLTIGSNFKGVPVSMEFADDSDTTACRLVPAAIPAGSSDCAAGTTAKASGVRKTNCRINGSNGKKIRAFSGCEVTGKQVG